MSKTENRIPMQSFIDALYSGKKCYTKKPNSWKKTYFWFEKINKENNNWFVNIADEVRVKGNSKELNESYWITAKQLEDWCNWHDRNGYKFHIDE